MDNVIVQITIKFHISKLNFCHCINKKLINIFTNKSYKTLLYYEI